MNLTLYFKLSSSSTPICFLKHAPRQVPKAPVFFSLISLFNNRRYNPQMDSPYIHTFYSMVAHLRTCLRYHHKGGGDSYKGRNSTVIPIAAAIL